MFCTKAIIRPENKSGLIEISAVLCTVITVKLGFLGRFVLLSLKIILLLGMK